ncbi:MAG: single-stranded-DNA-specific exonuclease RecJ, partial [Thiohalomonadaceae bacterium]
GRFAVITQRIVGEKHLKFRLRWPESEEQVEAIAFFVDDKLLQGQFSEVQIAYRVDVNEWNGKRNLQLLIEAIVEAR